MKNRITLFILGLFGQLVFSQADSEKIIHGKITAKSGNVTGVNIVNLVNEKSTSSDISGDFSILAKAGDVLVFSSVNLECHRKLIEEEDLLAKVVVIEMIPKITELDEVIVNKHAAINAVDLGISPKGIKHRTQMERKLYTAGDFKAIHLLGLLGGSLNTDALLNSINGRTAMIKKLAELEKKVILLEKTGVLFEEEYYTNTLKIPSECIRGFQYYLVENERFTTVLKTKNKTNIGFLMVELAEKYNEMIADQK